MWLQKEKLKNCWGWAGRVEIFKKRHGEIRKPFPQRAVAVGATESSLQYCLSQIQRTGSESSVLLTVNYHPHKQTQEDQVMLVSFIALGCFDKYVSNINNKLAYSQGQNSVFLLNSFKSTVFFFPRIFLQNSPTSESLASLHLLLMGGNVSSSRALIKVNLVPVSNPPGSLMDIHTSENAVKKLLKWNGIPAVAITYCSYFLVQTPGSSTTAYQQVDDGRKRCKSHKQ